MPKGPDMGQLMKQVQQMQAEMAKAQEQLKDETVEASAGGGMVKVTMTGDMKLREITISPDAIDPEDPELLRTWSPQPSTRRSAQPRSSPPPGSARSREWAAACPGCPGWAAPEGSRAPSSRPRDRTPRPDRSVA